MAQDKEYTISDLTPKQQTLLMALIEGKSKADAYREAYPSSRLKNPAAEVDHMINGGKYPNFTQVYARAREEANRKAEAVLEESIMKRTELLALLSSIARMDIGGAALRDRIKAMELIGKYLGVFEEKLHVDLNENPFAGLTTEELRALAGEVGKQ